MLDRLKITVKHTFVYGVGSLATKAIGIILLPLYTKHLTVTDYGVLGIFEITLFILAEFFTFGQKSSILRFYHLSPYSEKPKTTVFSISSFLVVASVLFMTGLYLLSRPISHCFENSLLFEVYIKLSASIIFFRIINGLFLNVLRIQEKSTIYVISNLLKLAVNLGLNIYLIAVLNMGVQGILISYLVSEIILLFILIPNITSILSIDYDNNLVRESLKYGFPLVFNALAALLLNMGNRYILKLLVDYKEVGLFTLGHKIAGLLNVFVIQSFSLSFIPLAYKIYGKKDDKRYYSKLLTYFSFILVWVGLGISLFNNEIVKIFTKSTDYWQAIPLIPILVLAYIFSGGKMVVSLGLFLEQQTKYIAISTICALIINIGLCFLLIPHFNMYGAAYAGLVSFIFLYIFSYYLAQKYYPIPYENQKLVILFIVGIVLFITGKVFFSGMPHWSLTLRLFQLMIFPIILLPFGFYEKVEIEKILKIIKMLFFKRKNNHEKQKEYH